MLRIRIKAGIGTYTPAGGSETEILRREVHVLDASGNTVAKLNVPTAARLAQAAAADKDGESLVDFGARLVQAVAENDAKLAEMTGQGKTARKSKTTIRPLFETEG
jgi:hypothetical protein